MGYIIYTNKRGYSMMFSMFNKEIFIYLMLLSKATILSKSSASFA